MKLAPSTATLFPCPLSWQMYQAKLFENQDTKNGVRRYGCSVHYHYVSENANSTETNNGQRMVQSTMTEMLANVSRQLGVLLHSGWSMLASAVPACLTRRAGARLLSTLNTHRREVAKVSGVSRTFQGQADTSARQPAHDEVRFGC